MFCEIWAWTRARAARESWWTGGSGHRWDGLGRLHASNGRPGASRRFGRQVRFSGVLAWATGQGVVSEADAAILLELASVQVGGPVHGLNSAAEIGVVATRHTVKPKTIPRGRDRAVRSLAQAHGRRTCVSARCPLYRAGLSTSVGAGCLPR
jgi:hypothetical protein